MSTNPLVHSFLAGTSKKGVERTARKRFPVLVPWKRKSPVGRILQVPRTGTSSRTEPKLISSYGVMGCIFNTFWNDIPCVGIMGYSILNCAASESFVLWKKRSSATSPILIRWHPKGKLTDAQITNRILSKVSNWHLDRKLETYFMIPMNKQYQRRACLCAGKCPVISRDNKPETYAWSINQNPINNPSYTNVSTMVLIRLHWIREVEQQT